MFGSLVAVLTFFTLCDKIQIEGDNYYAEYEAAIGIDGELLAGSLPVKQLKLVQAWAAIHEDELYEAWNNAVRNIPYGKIDPLE